MLCWYGLICSSWTTRRLDLLHISSRSSSHGPQKQDKAEVPSVCVCVPPQHRTLNQINSSVVLCARFSSKVTKLWTSLNILWVHTENGLLFAAIDLAEGDCGTARKPKRNLEKTKKDTWPRQLLHKPKWKNLKHSTRPSRSIQNMPTHRSPDFQDSAFR